MAAPDPKPAIPFTPHKRTRRTPQAAPEEQPAIDLTYNLERTLSNLRALIFGAERLGYFKYSEPVEEDLWHGVSQALLQQAVELADEALTLVDEVQCTLHRKEG